MLTISHEKIWKTSDGITHSTHEMAVQHIANEAMLDRLERDDRSRNAAQDILNDLGNYRRELREWLDAADAMEKAALR